MDRLSKQKINKETQVLNDTLDEMNLTDIFRTFHPNAEEYTFFLSAHRTFSWIGLPTSWVTNQTSVSLRKLKSFKHLLQPQRCETRYQLQEKNCKKHKHMEVKQHISK